MAPEVLRNAKNAERSLQIRLELSLTEGRQLQHWLDQLLQTARASDDLPSDLRRVLDRLNETASQAVHRIQCPICQEWFAQGTLGRNAQFCGPACRQKAYRQRINALKRQRPTARRRD